MSEQKSVINKVIFLKRLANTSETTGIAWNGIKSKEKSIAPDEGIANIADDKGVNHEIWRMKIHITMTIGTIAQKLATKADKNVVSGFNTIFAVSYLLRSFAIIPLNAGI